MAQRINIHDQAGLSIYITLASRVTWTWKREQVFERAVWPGGLQNRLEISVYITQTSRVSL